MDANDWVPEVRTELGLTFVEQESSSEGGLSQGGSLARDIDDTGNTPLNGQVV